MRMTHWERRAGEARLTGRQDENDWQQDVSPPAPPPALAGRCVTDAEWRAELRRASWQQHLSQRQHTGRPAAVLFSSPPQKFSRKFRTLPDGDESLSFMRFLRRGAMVDVSLEACFFLEDWIEWVPLQNKWKSNQLFKKMTKYQNV